MIWDSRAALDLPITCHAPALWGQTFPPLGAGAGGVCHVPQRGAGRKYEALGA